MTLTSVLLLIVAFYGLWSVHRWYDVRQKRKLKGPFPWPIFGSTFLIMYEEYMGRDRIEAIQKQLDETGGTSYMNIFGFDQITTIDPENIRYFCSKEENFANYGREPPKKPDTWDFKSLYLLFGQGIFVTDGHIWLTQRNLSMPLFSKASMDGMHEVFVQKALAVSAHLQAASASGEDMDLQDVFQKYTLDSFGKVGFGVEINSLEKPVPFSHAFNRAQYLLNEFFFDPMARFNSSMVKEFMEHVKTIDDFIYGILERPISEGAFDLLSQVRRVVDIKTKADEKFVRDITLNFAIAGRDTTACWLTWTMHCLNQNPEVYKKVREEIDAVLGNKEAPTPEDVRNLKYLANVLMEVLRLYPSVASVGFAQEDDTLPDGTGVRKGDFVNYIPYFMGRNEEYWTDAHTFNPDRWIQKDHKHNCQYIPFHLGPMQCLGRHMARIEVISLLSVILKKFSFKGIPAKPIVPYLGILMPAKNGAFFKVSVATN